ncbi:CHAD domain-containing protein [Microbacterium rhizomatis]|uniref:CHAD domain-containing protein n=1 Tax=Microbacterium rhizomatis TaxID=1631477 RepID=A0A5J5J829_9MICO|nr:CHAD domain-containing protein [Microbacterium rhizomatis]KAA9111145.1 CHAD domain-containing protein [Microbacterium rhizomatis]
MTVGKAAASEPTAGDVVTAALRDLVQSFDQTESAALAGELDGVHQHRTIVRRLRSVLGVFRDLFDPFAVKELRRSLQEWGTALGVVRDHEVAAQLADALVADVDAAASDARVSTRLAAPVRDATLAAHHRVVEIHDLERLRQMRRRLHEFAADPPLSAAAAEPGTTLRILLIDEAERVVREAKRPTASLHVQHAVRKRARRVAHAIEGAMTDPPGIFGDSLRAVAKAAHRIQSALGDHRDAVLLADRIDQARTLAGRAGEGTLVYDELDARARAFADERLRAVRPARKKLATAIERAAP